MAAARLDVMRLEGAAAIERREAAAAQLRLAILRREGAAVGARRQAMTTSIAQRAHLKQQMAHHLGLAPAPRGDTRRRHAAAASRDVKAEILDSRVAAEVPPPPARDDVKSDILQSRVAAADDDDAGSSSSDGVKAGILESRVATEQADGVVVPTGGVRGVPTRRERRKAAAAAARGFGKAAGATAVAARRKRRK